MPKQKGLYIDLPKLLIRETIDKLMLGYVLGYRHISPIRVLQVKKGIEMFMEDMKLSEEDYPLDSAIVTFYRMLSEYNTFQNESNTQRRKRDILQ